MRIERTGTMVPFLDVAIGQPFWAHDKVWIRTGYRDATVLVSTTIREKGMLNWGSVCDFTIDECDIMVEAMSCVEGD